MRRHEKSGMKIVLTPIDISLCVGLSGEKKRSLASLCDRHDYTVSGQNTLGIYIIPFALIQNTAHKQNTVCNNQLLKLQPAITNKILYATINC